MAPGPSTTPVIFAGRRGQALTDPPIPPNQAIRDLHAMTMTRSGRVIYHLPHGELRPEPGDLIIFPRHQQRHIEMLESPWRHVHMRFSAPPWPELLFPEETRAGPILVPLVPDLQEHFRAATSEVEERMLDDGDPWRVRRAWNAIEGFLLALHAERDRGRRGIDPRIARTLDHLHRHLAAEHSVAELARRVGLSRTAFSQRFSREIGVAPATYLERKRLERAADLLRLTTQPIGAIAATCGFADQRYFARRFRLAHGVTPSAWRAGT